MEGFEAHQRGKFVVHQFAPWIEQGIEHGFIGASGDFSESKRESEDTLFCQAFNVDSLFLPKQIHSDIIVIPDKQTDCTGDAVVVMSRHLGAIGIRTADCIPLIIRSSIGYGVVHAGWRGLAKGIIEKTISMLGGDDSLEVLIGPCAGSTRYEVGPEVIQAIGPLSVYSLTEDRIFLDLQQSASSRILASFPNAEIFTIPICTIGDTAFHSYRRQGDAKGSNLAFICV